jgi:hypothetical protein
MMRPWFLAFPFLLLAAPAWAGGFGLSGEVALLSRYVDEDLTRYTKGPALQPELIVTHEASGCYGSLWLSAGLAASSGDEADVTVGCERALGGGVTIDFSAARYLFRDGSMTAFSAGAAAGDWALRADYYIPEAGEDRGLRLVGEYSRQLNSLSLGAMLAHDTGPYDGVPPITTAGLTTGYSLSGNLAASASLLVPVAKREGDPRRLQAWATMRFEF